MTRKLFFIIIGVLAVAAVITDIQGSEWKKVIIPINTALILLLTFQYGSSEHLRFYKFILLALAVCVIGDVLPLLGDTFIWEMLVFLLAKYLYCEAFLSFKSKVGNNKLFGILIFISLLGFAFVFDSLGEYLVPTCIYLGMIIYFTWAGIKLHTSGLLSSSKLVLYAVITWLLCDVLSGIDRFTQASDLIGTVIIVAYWAAIFLISLSVLKPAEEADSATSHRLEAA